MVSVMFHRLPEWANISGSCRFYITEVSMLLETMVENLGEDCHATQAHEHSDVMD